MRHLLIASILACTSLDTIAQNDSADDELALPDPNATAFTLNGKAYTFDYLIQFSTLLVDNPDTVEVVSAYPVLTNIVADQELAAEAARERGLDQEPAMQETIRLITSSLLADAFMAQEVEARLTDERLEAAYQMYLEAFTPSPLATANHILVETEEAAQEIIARLNVGEDFSALAKELSIGPSGPNGGAIGTFGVGQMVAPFEDAAFALTPGTFSKEPVKTEYGFHVILLTELSETKPATFEAVLPDLSEIVGQQLQTEVREELREGTELIVVPYDLLPKQ